MCTLAHRRQGEAVGEVGAHSLLPAWDLGGRPGGGAAGHWSGLLAPPVSSLCRAAVVWFPGGPSTWAEEPTMPSSRVCHCLLSIYLVPDTVVDTGQNSSEYGVTTPALVVLPCPLGEPAGTSRQ